MFLYADGQGSFLWENGEGVQNIDGVFQLLDTVTYVEVNNHCGVYLGNDIFYHHAEERLSCRENLYPRWHKWLVGAYRYAA